MTVISIYEKQFSNIQKIQEAYSIEYCVVKSEIDSRDTYGIKLVSKKMSYSFERCIPDISYSFDEVVDILTFLYENCIEPDIAGDVVQDVRLKCS